MRGLVRLYVLISCSLSGALVCGALFTLVGLWLMPERVRDLARGLSESTGLALAGKEASPDAHPEPPPGPVAALAAQMARPAALESSSGAGKAAAAAETDSWVDVAALESRLRLLENEVPVRGAGQGTIIGAGPAEWKEMLKAWEEIRGPLFKFLSASAPAGAKGASFPEDADIRRLSGEVAARLTALLGERTALKRKLLQKMEPRALARLLVESQAFPDAQAVELLSQLSSAEASEVLERVSRWSPETAARLVRLVLAGESKEGRKGGMGEGQGLPTKVDSKG
jgi:hypothetical protein